MKFLEIVEFLQKQKENEGYVILVKNGIFFTGIGKDAVLLYETLGLRITCLKENMCKVGIPANSVETYITLLVGKDISFVMYEYLKIPNEDNEQYKLKFRFKGQKNFCNKDTIKDCKHCIRFKTTENIIIKQAKNKKREEK